MLPTQKLRISFVFNLSNPLYPRVVLQTTPCVGATYGYSLNIHDLRSEVCELHSPISSTQALPRTSPPSPISLFLVLLTHTWASKSLR